MIRGFLIGLATLSLVAGAQAQTFPSRTVTIVSQEVDATDSAWDESTASDGPPAPIASTDTLSAIEVPAIVVTAITLSGTASTIPAHPRLQAPRSLPSLPQ